MIERAMVTREGDSGLSVLEQMEVHRRAVTDARVCEVCHVSPATATRWSWMPSGVS